MCALLENMSIQYRVFENVPLHIVCSVRVCARVCVCACVFCILNSEATVT